ncbi:hypothetical protein P154DRAFT_46263 [Amniculicola lignicola CBS 123094]|uniref:DUF7607 domain-containing protein n=1 Tax=Amniculicola lignicola CBS 123094 TaxID=1392246 RepID=A0A6A5WRR9_9PLEO|nr:hypothetical protein P154DRAFT_46263 [Amniculicola lignicola CBS 123094]
MARDPWIWTVDDLISNICRSSTLFEDAGFGPPNCPDPSIFETLFNDHRIAGAALLTGINDNVLRNDLAVHAFGHRRALLAVIDLLRSRSLIYKQRTTTDPVGALNISGHQGERTVIDSAGRKRRKVAHLSTAPLSSRFQREQTVPRLQGFDDVNNEWDYLLDRYKDDDSDVLEYVHPLAQRYDNDEEDIENDGIDGESGTEEDGDDQLGSDDEHLDEVPDDELDDEPDELPLEADSRPTPVNQSRSKTKSLTKVEITRELNAAIDQYTHKWRPGIVKDHEREIPSDARVLWLSAGSAERRRELAKTKLAEIQFFKDGLDRMCNEMLSMDWKQAKTLRDKATVLDTMVFNIEQQRWELSVYEQELLPEKNDYRDMEPVESDTEGIDDDNGKHEGAGNSNQYDAASQHPSVNQAGGVPEIIDLGSPSGSDSDDYRMAIDSDILVTSKVQKPTRNDFVASDPMPSIEVPPVPQSSARNPLVQRSQVATPRATQPTSTVMHGDKPEAASLSLVRNWKWSDLVAKADRKRIVMKIILEMTDEEREEIRQRMKELQKQNLLREIRDCVVMMLKGGDTMVGVFPRDLANIVRFTRIFLSWWLAGNYMRREARHGDLQELATCLKEGADDPSTFYNWLSYILQNTFSRKALRSRDGGIPVDAEVIDLTL